MTASSDISAGDTLLATQYNDLRADVINTSTGHRHDGSDSRLVSVVIKKAADELVDNSVTLQNDNDFSFAIAANEKWLVKLVLVMNDEGGGDTPGIKIGLSVPSGCTFSGTGFLFDTSANGVSYIQQEPTSPFFQTSVLWPTTNQLDTVICEVIITNSSTAGTVQFQWAQNAASTNGTIVTAESYMVAHRDQS